MPRDNDKYNGSPRGGRERPRGGKGRSGKPRGPEKKLAKRGFGPKKFDRKFDSEHGGDRPRFRSDREDRPLRGRDRDEARPAGRFQDRKSRNRDRDRKGDPGDREFRGRRDDRQFKSRRDDREFKGRDRSDEKPWRRRDDRRGGDERPRFSQSREDRPKFERRRDDRSGGDERPKFGRPRWKKDDSREGRSDRPKFDRPRRDRDDGHRQRRPEGRAEWQEHPRSDKRFGERPRRDNEDDGKIFAKRPAFGGRGAYRERSEFDKREGRQEQPRKKTGERIAKVLARAGLASRRDAEAMVVQGRVTVNGRLINSPALDVTVNDVIAVDGEKLPPRERTRLFLYHKPRGLMTTHADPEGRPTVFDNLPEGLPRLISVGRLDFNTEGLLLLTNDGGLARTLELPETGWLRRYRVRAHGEVTQGQLDELKAGVDVEGVKYGPIDATLERDQGANVWLVFAIREGKNREVRNVLAHLGLDVNRLIRISYGPFQLGEIAEGAVEEVKTRVLREQLGEKVIARAGADFAQSEPPRGGERESDAPRGKKRFKPSGKNALVSDRKGHRVLVQRTGSEETRGRHELEASGYGPPRRPKRGYHGKRDLKPRDE